MANYGAKILNNAVGSLRAQQAIIATTGNNIANVNTPGYTRRVLHLQTAESSREGGLAVGNGVRIGNVERVADEYLQKLLYSATSEKMSTEKQDEFLARVENIFSLTGDRSTVGSTLDEFFRAINDLTANPSSMELRANVIQATDNLATTIRQNFTYLAALQSEADDRIATELQTVNALTAQIAELNTKVSMQEAGNNGNVAADERDQRDRLLSDLAEKISFSTLELPDGTINVTLSNGFTLVSGATSRSLEVTQNPGFNNPNGTAYLPRDLNGGILSYIVYDTSPGANSSHINLTDVLQAGEGTIGGYLKVRGAGDPDGIDYTGRNAFGVNGTIPQVAARLEAIARTLLTQFNDVYLGYDSAAAAQVPPRDLNGRLPTDPLSSGSEYALFDYAYGGAVPRDQDGDGRPEQGDLENIQSIYPSVFSFANRLTINKQLASDPARLAAARETAPGVWASGDGRNMEAIAAWQKKGVALGAGNGGPVFPGATMGEAYNQTVGYVGNLKAASTIAAKVATDNFTTAADRRDQVSAVSLDEEFTQLISFQKAYQASARMIKVADDLLQQVVQLI